MKQIVLTNVTVSYGQDLALRDVSLAFVDNVTTAVVGSSGGGKSTLLQLINGLVRPAAGSVTVLGSHVDYQKLSALRLQIGYAVQGTALFPHMTVEGNITLLARLAKWAPDRVTARMGELMRLVGLSPALARRYPHELSGGQQQRVGLCRAMMLDPKIFLLDEPFGALDSVTRDEIHGELLQLQKAAPRTVVIVTHDIGEALKLAERIVVLDHGVLLQHGTCEEIMRNPASDFVRRLCHGRDRGALGTVGLPA